MHTPGPLIYRPHKYDDWGYVRAERTAEEQAEGLPGRLVAVCRAHAHCSDQELAKHRADKTDPDEHDARLLAAAYTSYDRAFGPAAVEAAEADLLVKMVEVLKGHESPQLWRLEWLATLIDEIDAGTIEEAANVDPSAFSEMMANVREMRDQLRAILARVPEGGGA